MASGERDLRGKPFTTKSYPFQRQILDDEHPNKAVEKCSQVGLTTIQIMRVLAFLYRMRNTTAMYTLPSEKLYKRVSQSRIKPVLDENPVLVAATESKSVRTVTLVQIGLSFLHITGMTEDDATSTPADYLSHDEVDLSEASMLALFQSRLQNSDHKITERFSTPSFHGYGINASFELSDQHLYMARCKSCNHWQHPDFDLRFLDIPGLPSKLEELHDLTESDIHLLDIPNIKVVCEKCRKPLELDDPKREWVPTYPTRTTMRGYRVSPFCTTRISPVYVINQLIEYKQRDYLRGWYNTVLGRPYSGGNVRLDKSEIEACFTGQSDTIDTSNPVCIGIDVGLLCHVTIGTGSKVHHFEIVPQNLLIERLKELKKRFNIVGGCIDRHPYTPTAEEARDLFDRKVMPVEYRGSKDVAIVKDELGQPNHAQADRTPLIDALAKAIRRREIEFAGFHDLKTTIIDHLRNAARDERPGEQARWVKLNKEDHFLHSLGLLVFSLRVMNALREDPEEIETRRCAFPFVSAGNAKPQNLISGMTYRQELYHGGL